MAFAETKFFALLRPFTRGFDQVQVDSVNAILRHSEGLPTAQVAYIFATAWHESHLRPVREGFAATDARAREIIKHREYGFADKITGQVYYGRGLVQLTWKRNYAFAGKQLGLDLVNHPDLALEPENAARILVQGMTEGWFTARKLNNYINAAKSDYEGARAIVNGTDKAALIAGYARQIEAMLRKAAA